MVFPESTFCKTKLDLESLRLTFIRPFHLKAGEEAGKNSYKSHFPSQAFSWHPWANERKNQDILSQLPKIIWVAMCWDGSAFVSWRVEIPEVTLLSFLGKQNKKMSKPVFSIRKNYSDRKYLTTSNYKLPNPCAWRLWSWQLSGMLQDELFLQNDNPHDCHMTGL